VEIDGQGHAQEGVIAHDRRRSVWLAAQGVDVIRFAAEEVRVNLDGVPDAIRLVVRARAKSPSTASRSPSPLRSARGEET